ncbi:hypothetical protein, partial [uncultured Thiodictyon sp.]|uniref:hypothetical protein n=1 Tax=uncultured Thiodictyon sp. TaxID=1846217 RepID=UPI0025D2AA5B
MGSSRAPFGQPAPLNRVRQLQSPFDPLQSTPQVSDLVSADGVDRVESGEVMIDRGKSGLDASEAQAQLRLDVIQL